MRNQQPEMPPQPRQQPTSRELQLWQQQIMLKQLHELQKQQHSQQLNQVARQQNLPGQAATKPGVVNQLPPLLSGMPVNVASNYMLPHDFMDGESKIPSNSQMFIAGNMNWAQGRGLPVVHASNGFLCSNDHGQATRSIGLASQQIDQSLYGMPVSSSRGLLERYPQIQSSIFTNMMTKAGRSQLEKPLVQSVPSSISLHNDQYVPVQSSLQDALNITAQCFQDKGFTGNATSDISQQVNHSQHNVETQEVHGREEQDGWSADLEEASTVVGTSHGMTSLDPTEEKILFGSDDDGNWAASLNALHDNRDQYSAFSSTQSGSWNALMQEAVQLQGNSDQYSAFPSTHSGSWSALMQEAVQASSSGEGFQEEWSGLIFQNTEPLFGNHSAVSNGIGKHQIAWNNNNNLPGASSAASRDIPLFNAAAADSTCLSAHSFPHSIRGTYEQNDKTHTDTSHESFDDVQNMDFDQSHKQKSFDENRLQAHMQLHNVPNGVWSKNMYGKCAKTAHSVSMEFNPHNDQKNWTQQKIPVSNVACQPSATSIDWNISLASSRGKISEVQDNDGRVLYCQNVLKRKDHSDGSIMDVGQNCMKDPAKCDIGSSQMHSEVSSVANFAAGKHSNTLNTNQDMNHHVLNRHEVDVMRNVAFDSFFKSRGENVEKYQHGPYAHDSVVNDIDRSPSVSDSQTSSGISGWKSVGSHRSQQHQNVGHNIELQRSISGPQDIQQRSSMPNQESPSSASFDESTADFVQNANIGQTRQHMLELLHKVDQSRDTNTLSAFVHSNCNALHDPYESGSSVGSDFHPQRHQTSGVGLRLAPPPQQQSLSNQTLLCQTSLFNSDSRQLEPEAEDKDHMQSASVAFNQSLHPSRERSQSEIQSSRQNLSEQACKQVLYSLSQGNSSAVMASNLPHLTQQLQLQQKQQYLQQQRAFGMRGSQTDADDRARYASLRRPAQSFQDQAVNPATQKASSTFPRRLLPFRLTSTADIHAPSSEFNSPDTVHSQSINSDFYHIRSSGQQPPRSETRPILQASAASIMSHNVWTNASIQQGTSGGKKHNPSVPQCIILDSSIRAPDSAIVKVDDEGIKEEQEQVPKHHSDENSAVLSSMESLPQQDPYMSKHCQESLLKPQPDHVSLPITGSPNSGIGTYGRSMIPSDVQYPNYALLQQVQAVKGADSYSNKMAGKRLKGDFISDASQGYIYGQNTAFRVPADGELGTASANSLLPDIKMLSLSVREKEEKFSGGTSQLFGREMASQDTHTSGQHDSKIHLSSTSNYMRRNEHTHISPQMARSWFQHYRKYKNDQMPVMDDDQRSAKAASQQYSPAEVSEGMDSNPLVEQGLEGRQFSFMAQSRSPSNRAGNELSPCEPLDIPDQDMIMRPKKRKTAITDLLPWHKEVVQGYQRLKSISSADHDWAGATNRLTEKVEDEAELIDDASLVPRARRRLVLSTQLVQELLPSVPAPILAAEVTSSYESVPYFLAKSVLGRACSLVSFSGSDSREHLDIGNRIVDKVRISEKASVVIFSKIVEGFIGRSKKLESDLLRLDKRTPLLDVRLECHDLERFSLLNRLGKFHGRSQTDGAGSTSTSQNASRKLLPQRYVTALSISGNLPEGVICISL